MDLINCVYDYLPRFVSGYSPPTTMDRLCNPEFEHFGKSNDPPPEHIACMVRSTLVEAYHEVNNMRIAVKEAWMSPEYEERVAERRALDQAVERAEKILAPIRKLPPEILANIMSLCGSGKHSFDTKSFPFTGLYVCKSWYNVALSHSELWSTIRIPMQHLYAGDCHRRVELQLHRSREHLLRVIISSRDWHPTTGNIDDWVTKPAFQALMLQSARWRSAELPITGNAQPFLHSLTGKLPFLVHLTIGMEDLSVIPDGDFQPQYVLHSFYDAPRLRTLNIRHHVLIDHFYLPRDGSHAGMRTRSHTDVHELDSFSTIQSINKDAVHEILEQYPHLQTLSVAIGRTASSSALDLFSRPYPISGLHVTSIVFNQAGNLGKDNASLFRAMSEGDWPHLERLTVPLTRKYSGEVARLVRKVSSTLKVLDIHVIPGVEDDTMTGEALVCILQEAKELERLYLYEDSGPCPYLVQALTLLSRLDLETGLYHLCFLNAICVLSNNVQTHKAYIDFVWGRLEDPEYDENGERITPGKLSACAFGFRPGLDVNLQRDLCLSFNKFISYGVNVQLGFFHGKPGGKMEIHDYLGGRWD